MLAAPAVRMKSPINLLNGPEPAYLRWADENRSFQAGMAASRVEVLWRVHIQHFQEDIRTDLIYPLVTTQLTHILHTKTMTSKRLQH